MLVTGETVLQRLQDRTDIEEEETNDGWRYKQQSNQQGTPLLLVKAGSSWQSEVGHGERACRPVICHRDTEAQRNGGSQGRLAETP